MRARLRIELIALLSAACVGTAPPELERPRPIRQPLTLPDSTGFGTHVLMMSRAPDRSLWVGTYGKGIYVLPPDSGGWTRIAARANDSHALSWNFVNSLAFTRDSAVWYGTVGNGFGYSRDRGRTWTNWTVSRLGPEWQYVAADGIRTRGDTVYVATADGLRITWDSGRSWRCIQGVDRVAGGAAPRPDGCTERLNGLPTEYLLALEIGDNGTIWVGHLKGVSMSRDQGRTWTTPEARTPIDERVRAIESDTMWAWVATERRYFRGQIGKPFEEFRPRAPGWPELPGQPRTLVAIPEFEWPLIGLSSGLAGP